MSKPVESGHNRVMVPPGDYWLGDPVYSNGKRWHLIVDDYLKNSPIGSHGKVWFIAFGTIHGDGIFQDQDGREYPVDSGTIGLTPVAFATKAPFGSHRVSFSEPIECRLEGHVLHFGEIEINLDGEEDEEECRC